MRPARGAWAVLLLSLVGLALSGYLVYLHLGLLRGELLGGAACTGSGAFNCHAVTGGAWGKWLGIPLSLWGCLGYLTLFALALLAQQSPEWSAHAFTLIALLAVAFVVVDLALFAVMAFVIRLYCFFCLLTYAVNLPLFFIAARSLAYPGREIFGRVGPALGALIPSSRRPAAGLFWGIMIVALAGVASLEAATLFVSRGKIGNLRHQVRDFMSKQPRVSVNVADDPMLGPPGAPIQMVEFSDFLCPACQRASKLNTVILANHRRDAVFIFKHYPLETSCNSAVQRTAHVGACAIAAASECAHQQGKFWPFHDLVFEQGHAYRVAAIEQDAGRLGLDMPRFRACMESGQGLEAVKRDIAEGAKIGVVSTPTYVINGVQMVGGINPTMFEDVVEVLRESRNP